MQAYPEAYDAVSTPKEGLYIGAYFKVEGINEYEVYKASAMYGAVDKEILYKSTSWNDVLEYVNKV